MWQQLELASELEFGVQKTVDWGSKWLVDFNAGKAQIVSLDWSCNSGSIFVKMDVSDLEEKSSFKILGFLFSNKLNWGSYIWLLLNPSLRKLEPWFVTWSFFLLTGIYPIFLTIVRFVEKDWVLLEKNDCEAVVAAAWRLGQSPGWVLRSKALKMFGLQWY